jgi:hypothetical protein
MRAGWRVLLAGLLAMTADLNAQEASPSPKPGKEEELLHRFEGEWYARTAFPAPGQESPRECFGSEKCLMTLGNHWLAIEYVGMEGQPIESRVFLGYDPQKQKFVGTWINNVSSSLLTFEGAADDAGKCLTLRLQGTDPKTGKKFDQRHVYDFENGNRRSLKVYRTDEGGQERLVRETFYTRKAILEGGGSKSIPFRPFLGVER